MRHNMNNTRRKQIRAIADRIKSEQSALREIWLGELESGRDEEAISELDRLVDEMGEIVNNLKQI